MIFSDVDTMYIIHRIFPNCQINCISNILNCWAHSISIQINGQAYINSDSKEFDKQTSSRSNRKNRKKKNRSSNKNKAIKSQSKRSKRKRSKTNTSARVLSSHKSKIKIAKPVRKLQHPSKSKIRTQANFSLN